MLKRGGDYLFALKADRPAMLKAVAAFFAEPGAPAMPGLATLACVEAIRDDGATAVRFHWAIENSLHWVPDVIFDDDAA